MRRLVFTTLGILEGVAAVILFTFAAQLPGPAEVHETVGRAERVSSTASSQVKRLRAQVQGVRSNQPKIQSLTLQLQAQLRNVNDNVPQQSFDPTLFENMSRSLGEVAKGLDGLSDALGSQRSGQARYLDGQVAPEADRTADRLEKTTVAVKGKADALGALLRQAPLDGRTARSASALLGTLDEDLAKAIEVLETEDLVTLRDGFAGLATSLTTGAAQMERLAGVTYPTVHMEDGHPVLEPKSLWPEGKKTAEGMKKVARAAGLARKELDALNRELPKVRASLESSHTIVRATKEALDAALVEEKAPAALRPLALKQTALLARKLPQLSADLEMVLRATAKLKEVSAGLRRAEKAVEVAAERWPQFRTNLGKSAELLRATKKQLDAALARREQFEALARQTLLLARMWAEALPLLTEQLDAHLEQQEGSLGELAESLDDVSAALPATAATATRLLVTTKLLLRLVGAIVVLHAGYVLLSGRAGAR